VAEQEQVDKPNIAIQTTLSFKQYYCPFKEIISDSSPGVESKHGTTQLDERRGNNGQRAAQFSIRPNGGVRALGVARLWMQTDQPADGIVGFFTIGTQ
jgi:hypothetical protein